MANLLEGVRVLDLTSVLAGPFCSYQLACLGADIVKIEAPERGDLARQLGADPDLNDNLMGVCFLAQNAGKRSITLNLKHEDGKTIFRELAADAAVVLENFRPGVMARLGLGYETLREINPSLVYCAISGYGQDGPRRDNPAYDQIIQGRSGVMSITGDADSAPLRTGHPVCDATGGLTAAFAVAAALHRRAVTGEGRFIDVSMLESMLATMSWAVANHTIAGVAPAPMGNENPTGAPSGAFRTRDGVLNVAANTQAMFDTLCRLIGREDLARDPRFRDRDERKRNRAALNAEIERAFAERDTAEWEEMLNREGIPAGPVLDVPTAIADEQIAARGFRHILSAPPGVDRDIDVLRAGFRLSGGDPAVDTPPPVLGRHTEQILAELGYADVQIRDFASRGVI